MELHRREQGVLLKKIEELTLYVIEQNKKIEQLERENEGINEFWKEIEATKKSIKR